MSLRGKRLAVVKTGSAVLVDPDGGIRDEVLDSIARDTASLRRSGWDVMWVASGAVARGKALLDVEQERNYSLTHLQAISAIGQGHVYQRVAEAFGDAQLTTAQMLLTFAEVTDRSSYLRIRDALDALLHWGVVPILNENDSVTTEGVSFGNNDWLAAQLASLMSATKLVLLTNVPGVMTRDPRSARDGAELVREVADIEALLSGADGPTVSDRVGHQGRGGMRAKLRAAQLATRRGIPVVISSIERGGLVAHVEGPSPGTTVHPREEARGERSNFRFWLQHARPATGHVTIDPGAVAALRRRRGGGSLLAVGVVAARGEFAVGDPIEVRDAQGELVAKGITQYSSREVKLLLAARTHLTPENLPDDVPDEVIHRDQMIVYGKERD